VKKSEDVRQGAVSARFSGVLETVLPLVYLIFSLVLRWPSFIPSVIDHDESTYLLIARELLNGASLYGDVWDNKPPGIFLLFAALQYLFGPAIWPVRLAGAAMVALTAFFVDRSVRALGGSSREALFGGITALLLLSMHRSGLAANTELFFLPFVAAACWLFLIFPRYGLVDAALLCGMGALFKPVTLFDFAAFWGTSCLLWMRQDGKERPSVVSLGTAPILFSLPSLILFAVIPLFGDRDELWHVLFVLPSRYRQEYAEASWLLAGTLLLFLLRFAWVVIPFVRNILVLWREKRDRVALPLLWIAAVLSAVVLPGKFFDHYLLHLVPPIAVFAAPELVRLWDKAHRAAPRMTELAVRLIPLFFFMQMSSFVLAPDIPQFIAGHLKERISSGERIFADERLQIIPYLLGSPLASRYVHPTLITKPGHNTAFGINGVAEIESILAKRPRYLIVGDTFRFRSLLDRDDSRYRIVGQYPGIRGAETLLYRREDP